MRAAFRRRVLPRGGFLQHALDALGREALLRQRDAAVEHLAIAGDAAVAEHEVPDAPRTPPACPARPASPRGS
jgi:hypothetical protein